jgi:hypothetical protein
MDMKVIRVSWITIILALGLLPGFQNAAPMLDGSQDISFDHPFNTSRRRRMKILVVK